MSALPTVRLTPWVRRLALGLTAIQVLLQTVVTAPAVREALRFDPAARLSDPWTLLTWPLVHAGIVHLGLVVGLLLVAGPTVERRMGSRLFPLFWIYCTVGAALVALGLAALAPTPPLAGALGPVLGLVFAFGWYAEDDEVALAPIPARVRIRVLVASLAGLLLIAGLAARTPALALAHLGALPAAWIFLRLAGPGRRPPAPPPLPMRRPVMTPIRLEVEASTGAQPAPPQAAPTRDRAPAATSEDVNRVLDKISATGLASLTDEERRILTAYAEHKRRGMANGE